MDLYYNHHGIVFVSQHSFWVLYGEVDHNWILFSLWRRILFDVHYDRAYIFLVKLVSHPPANPPAAVFSVWHLTLASRTSYIFFPFFYARFFKFGSSRIWLLFPSWPPTTFTYDDNWSLWIKISISFFHWWEFYVWCPRSLWYAHHTLPSFPS